MAKKACIETKAREYLNAADARDLLALFAKYQDQGMSEAEATQAAIKEMATGNIAIRDELSAAAAEYGAERA